MFSIFPILFTIVFIFIFGTIVFSAIRGALEWNKNNNSPVLTVEAKVVTKRTNVSNHAHQNHISSRTTYYVTFEVESGDRIELMLPAEEYGMLVEGDMGKLTFQGKRYKGYLRN